MNAFPSVTLPDVDQEVAAEVHEAAEAGALAIGEAALQQYRLAALIAARNPGTGPRHERTPRQAAAAKKARKAARASRKANR